jgi:hypothetical protein
MNFHTVRLMTVLATAFPMVQGAEVVVDASRAANPPQALQRRNYSQITMANKIPRHL